ncbi:MAG: O-antigen ligase family protein, partial [Thermoleophilaceae bacterium]|nr:O-antigen ligase family protein [Thermoleophilaceae bacterium]
PGLVAVALSSHAAGRPAAISAFLGVVMALALVIRGTGGAGPGELKAMRTVASLGIVALPAGLTLYLSFNAGGFFPDATGVAVLALAYVLIARVALVDRPFAGFTVPLGIATGALTLYAVWTLVSVVWSDAPERALVEFQRAALYSLTLTLFASVPRIRHRLEWLVRALALVIVAICTAALITRLLPGVWSIPRTFQDSRLNYPLTYWNSLGLLAAIGLVLCFHLASSEREPPLARILGAAVTPLLGAALVLTLSRGAIAAGAMGLLIYMAVGRPRALLPGLVAAVPATVIAVIAAYDADLLVSSDPTTAQAVVQGNRVALTIALCAVGAAVLRLVLLPLDAKLAAVSIGTGVRRVVLVSVVGACLVAVLGLSLTADLPGEVRAQYDRFVKGDPGGGAADPRSRLTDVGNRGRVEQWRVAVDDFGQAELLGRGAGTWGLSWNQRRPTPGAVRDAHSLYLEVLGELGITGAALLAAALATLLGGAALRARGPVRAVYGAVFGAGSVWALHAAVDWDWEMPATTAWIFALTGAGLAAPRAVDGWRDRTNLAPRIAAIVILVAVAIPSALLAASETQLSGGIEAVAVNDCPQAVAAAKKANSPLGLRAYGYEVEGYCAAARGRGVEAMEAMQKAVDVDPDNWEPHYGLAIVRAAAGMDPGPAARRAEQLNP